MDEWKFKHFSVTPEVMATKVGEDEFETKNLKMRESPAVLQQQELFPVKSEAPESLTVVGLVDCQEMIYTPCDLLERNVASVGENSLGSKTSVEAMNSSNFTFIHEELDYSNQERLLHVSDTSPVECETRNKSSLFNQASPVERPFKCDYCTARFPRKTNLVCHIRTHTGEKPFQCDSCSAKFALKSYLVCHLRTHTGEKPFECTYCSSRFAQKSDLNRHSRTHAGEMPFKCDFCSSRFTVKSNLVSHRRTHTGEKPFKCETCSARFKLKHHLICHSRTHTGEKPFKCDCCSAAFAQKGNLVSHSRTHFGSKLFNQDGGNLDRE